MTGIKDLPVELLGITFQYVAAPGFRVHEERGVSDVELPAVPDRTLFPLNVAAVCTLWLRVLKLQPQHWQRVVIDVASDPAPFLDTLDLFPAESDIPLDLIVFCSQPAICKDVESSRAGIVFAYLEPHMERYATITFRLVYQSSLPLSRAFLCRDLVSPLKELFLICTIYDLSDDAADDGEVPRIDDYRHSRGVAIHTNLRKLCLTGFDIMDLCLSGVLQTPQDIFQISINQIKFRQQFRDGTSSSRSFAVLAEFLYNVIGSSDVASISLFNISMGYRPSLKRNVKHPITVARMSFTNVSADFISAFFSTFTILAGHLQFVSFRNCVIPRITEWYHHIHVVGSGVKLVLELVDIPFRDNDTARPSDQVLLLDRDESLYNAIEAFTPD
ncbi:hypothetical protein HYPSUDRAFT_204586 [Hypholoma sublateritium FD-334 SS-4]|uniref:F-box domain-containing protein n=1 Tax=Hypholoma sublateritium (strain FD-334 SS-4) TaxID=945553 RepID=A0A0D2NKE0_HYPSF|nr:hypothetical protein HYPSUDRAFT_204586 [Hypholoma sublateritium FD-334 SS-4]